MVSVCLVMARAGYEAGLTLPPKKTRNKKAERPVRTREHYIDAVNRNYVEGIIVQQGHAADEPRPDYGYDIVVTTFDYKGDVNYRRGEVENGFIFIQLKATDNLHLIKNGTIVSYNIERKHAIYWHGESNPVYLVVYSVAEKVAYWLHMQPYLWADTFKMPPDTQEKFAVHLPRTQVLSAATVDEFRKTKQDILARIEGLYLWSNDATTQTELPTDS